MSEIVMLRDVIDRDLLILFEHQLDQEATHMAAFPSRDHDGFMAHWAKILADPTVITKTILLGGQVAGSIASFGLPAERDVGYWIGKEFWGRGIATQALEAFLEIETTRPIFGRVAKHNIGSIRVLEKCGFVRAGEDSGFLTTNGKPVEEWIMKLD